MNVADDLMNSISFFIRNDHHGAIFDLKSLSFVYLFTRILLACILLALCFDSLASVYRRRRQKTFDTFEKPRHGSQAAFYKGLKTSQSQYNDLNWRNEGLGFTIWPF